MAKGEEVGSDRSELKRLLKIAVDRPIHMAFALNADGKAVISLDKMKPPRALEKDLKESKGTSKHRFGMVHVDPENPKIAKFVVNKEVGGFARKLVIALKGTGFNKVQIVTEDGVTVEEEEGEEEETEEGNGRPAPAQARGGDEPATSRAAPEATSRAAPEAPAAPPAGGGQGQGQGQGQAPAQAQAPKGGQPDAAALTKDLTGLVRQMLAVIKADPSQKSALAELATDAQVSLKRGDLDQAAGGIEILREAIEAAGSPAPGVQGGAQGGAPGADGKAANGQGADGQAANGQAANGQDAKGDGKAGGADGPQVMKFRKSRIAWTATRAKIDSELQKLGKAIMAASDGEDMGDDLESEFYSAVDPVLSTLDESLSDVLEQAASADDGSERQQLMDQARKTLDRYMSFVQGNKIISDLDNNPFVPLQIGKTLTSTLTTLSTMMR